MIISQTNRVPIIKPCPGQRNVILTSSLRQQHLDKAVKRTTQFHWRYSTELPQRWKQPRPVPERVRLVARAMVLSAEATAWRRLPTRPLAEAGNGALVLGAT